MKELSPRLVFVCFGYLTRAGKSMFLTVRRLSLMYWYRVALEIPNDSEWEWNTWATLWPLSRISGVMIWSICASPEEPVRIFLRDSWGDFSYACYAMDGSYLYFNFFTGPEIDTSVTNPRRHSGILLW